MVSPNPYSNNSRIQFDTKHTAAHIPTVVEADIKVNSTNSILPTANTTAVSTKEMDVKCTKEHLEPLNDAEIKAIDEIKNRKFILSPKTIVTDEFSCGLKEISISLSDLQKYILEKKIPNEPKKMQKGFIVGGMATYLLMSHRTPSSPPIIPGDIDNRWYVGKDFLKFKDYVFDYFWDKFKVTPATLSNYYLKNPTVTITDDFILFQFPEIDIKFAEKQTGSRSNISYSDGFQYSFNENYLIAIDNGVICNQANFERAVYAAKHYHYPIDNWDAPDRREIIFRLFFKMTHGQFLTPKTEMFIGLIKKVLVDIDKYQFTEKFKKKFNKSDMNHFENCENAQAIHFLNALQLGCEARVDKVAALALGEYSNALAAAWNDKDRGDPWSNRKAWNNKAKPRLLTGFAGLIQSRYVQSDIAIIPKFLNVFRGIFLLEWLDSVQKGNERITAYSFPFSSKEHPIRMQFGLKSKNEPNISYLALEEHHDPYTIAKDFIQSWQELDSSLPKIYSETFQALPSDLGISQLRLTKENRQKVILELIKAFSIGPVASKIQELFKENGSINFYEFILESASEALDTATYIKLHSDLLKLAKTEAAKLELKQLTELELLLQASAKSNNPYEGLLNWLEKCHNVIDLKNPLNEILKISIKKVIVDQITKSKESFTSLKEHLVEILHFCEELTIISEAEKAGFFMQFLSIQYKNDDIQNLLFTLSINLELKKIKNPSFELRNLLRLSETDALKKILDYSKKDLDKASFVNMADALTFLTANFVFQKLDAEIKKIVAFALQNPQGSFLTKAYEIVEAYLQRDNQLFLESELLARFIDLAIALQKIPTSQLDNLPHSHYHALNSKLLIKLITVFPHNEQIKTEVFDQLIHMQMFDSVFLTEADVKSNNGQFIPNSLFQETVETYLRLTKAPKDMEYKFRYLISTNIITEKERSEIFSRLIQLVSVQHPVQAVEQLIDLSEKGHLAPSVVEELACYIIHKPAIGGLGYRYDAWKILAEAKENVAAQLPNTLNKIAASSHVLNTFSSLTNSKLETRTKEIFNFLIQTLANNQEQFKKISATELEKLNIHISQALQHISKINPEVGIELSEHLFKVADQCQIKLKNQSTTFFRLLHKLKSQHPEKAHDQKLIVKESESDNKQIIEDICNLIKDAAKDSTSLPYAIIAATKLLQSSLISASLNSFAPSLTHLIEISSDRSGYEISGTDFKQLIQSLIDKNLIATIPVRQKLQLLKLAVATNDSVFLNTFWQKVKEELPSSRVLFDLTKMMSQGFNIIEKSGILLDVFSLFIQTSQLNNAEEIQRISKELHGNLISSEMDTKSIDSSMNKASRTYQLLNLLTIQQNDQDRKYPIDKLTSNNYCAAIVNGFAAFNSNALPYFTSQLSKRPDLTNLFLDVIRGILFIDAHKKSTNAGPNPITAFLFSSEGAQDEVRSQICDNRHGHIFNLELLKKQDPIELASRFITSWRTLLKELKGEDLKNFYSIAQDLEISNNFMFKENLYNAIQQLLELVHSPEASSIVKQLGKPTHPAAFYESLFSNSFADLNSSQQLEIHYVHIQKMSSKNEFSAKLDGAELKEEDSLVKIDAAKSQANSIQSIKKLLTCMDNIKTTQDNALLSIFNWLNENKNNGLIADPIFQKTLRTSLLEAMDITIGAVPRFQTLKTAYGLMCLANELHIFTPFENCSAAFLIFSALKPGWSKEPGAIITLNQLYAQASALPNRPGRLEGLLKDLYQEMQAQLLPMAHDAINKGTAQQVPIAATYLNFISSESLLDPKESQNILAVIETLFSNSLIQKTSSFLIASGEVALKQMFNPKLVLSKQFQKHLLDLGIALCSLRKNQIDDTSKLVDCRGLGRKLLKELSDRSEQNVEIQKSIQDEFLQIAASELTSQEELSAIYNMLKTALLNIHGLKDLAPEISKEFYGLSQWSVTEIQSNLTKFLDSFILAASMINPAKAASIFAEAKFCRQLDTAHQDKIALHFGSKCFNGSEGKVAAFIGWQIIRANSAKSTEHLLEKLQLTVNLAGLYMNHSLAKDYVASFAKFFILMLNSVRNQKQKLDTNLLNRMIAKFTTEILAFDPQQGMRITEAIYTAASKNIDEFSKMNDGYIGLMNMYLAAGQLPAEATTKQFLTFSLDVGSNNPNSPQNIVKTTELLIAQCIKENNERSQMMAQSIILKLLQSPFIPQYWNASLGAVIDSFIANIPDYLLQMSLNDSDTESLINVLIQKKLLEKLVPNSVVTLLGITTRMFNLEVCQNLWNEILDLKLSSNVFGEVYKSFKTTRNEGLLSIALKIFIASGYNDAELCITILEACLEHNYKVVFREIHKHLVYEKTEVHNFLAYEKFSLDDNATVFALLIKNLTLRLRKASNYSQSSLKHISEISYLWQRIPLPFKKPLQNSLFEAYLFQGEGMHLLAACQALVELGIDADMSLIFKLMPAIAHILQKSVIEVITTEAAKKINDENITPEVSENIFCYSAIHHVMNFLIPLHSSTLSDGKLSEGFYKMIEEFSNKRFPIYNELNARMLIAVLKFRMEAYNGLKTKAEADLKDQNQLTIASLSSIIGPLNPKMFKALKVLITSGAEHNGDAFLKELLSELPQQLLPAEWSQFKNDLIEYCKSEIAFSLKWNASSINESHCREALAKIKRLLPLYAILKTELAPEFDRLIKSILALFVSNTKLHENFFELINLIDEYDFYQTGDIAGRKNAFWGHPDIPETKIAFRLGIEKDLINALIAVKDVNLTQQAINRLCTMWNLIDHRKLNEFSMFIDSMLNVHDRALITLLTTNVEITDYTNAYETFLRLTLVPLEFFARKIKENQETTFLGMAISEPLESVTKETEDKINPFLPQLKMISTFMWKMQTRMLKYHEFILQNIDLINRFYNNNDTANRVPQLKSLTNYFLNSQFSGKGTELYHTWLRDVEGKNIKDFPVNKVNEPSLPKMYKIMTFIIDEPSCNMANSSKTCINITHYYTCITSQWISFLNNNKIDNVDIKTQLKFQLKEAFDYIHKLKIHEIKVMREYGKLLNATLKPYLGDLDISSKDKGESDVKAIFESDFKDFIQSIPGSTATAAAGKPKGNKKKKKK